MTTWVETYTTALEACVADALGSLCSWGVIAGDTASLDYCGGCDDGCGQWWIAVQAIYPYTRFPEQDDAAPCTAGLGALIQVGVSRCFPVHEDGTPATHDEHAEAFAQQMADAFALRKAIMCCQDGFDVRLSGWAPMGPEGGCVGGAWTLNVTRD